MRYIIALIMSLVGSNITYKIYMNITDLKFTVAFIGGATTLIIVQMIIIGKQIFDIQESIETNIFNLITKIFDSK